MEDREKLTKLLLPMVESELAGDCSSLVRGWADYLIANGVTIQTWIPVSERLPREYKAVIVWTKFHEIGEAQYNGKRFEWLDDEGNYDYAYVTHWMPLPEPPKDD